jgi:GH15 family glucan-1,4-alpha-glucosidase
MVSEKIHKYNLGLIGNCAYMSHINTKAEIVWSCFPRFDSSFIFGKLIDETNGGFFGIYPVNQNAETVQYYLENTNVLCTEFNSDDGRFRVIDFAPRFFRYERFFKPLWIFRKIQFLDGSPRIIIRCHPRDAYNKKVPRTQIGSNHIQYSDLSAHVRLTSNIPLNYIAAERPFVLSEDRHLVFQYGMPLEAPLESVVEEYLKKTIEYWRGWVKYSTICNFHQEHVIRSALVLKLHQYQDTGAIIASGTTSLPEFPGTGRNWDYRYCWIRDAFYTLTALSHIGQGAELERYAQYIRNVAIAEDGRYCPVYSIIGDSDFKEKILDIPGYLGNSPVRIGNQARVHIQNDVYGQILISLLPLYADKRFFVDKRHHNSIELIFQLLELIESTMSEPDAGIWEFRNISQQHCYTFLFHWAGSAAAVKIAKTLKNEKMMEKASNLLKQSTQKIESCYDPELKAYTQAIGGKHFDASLLQLITMNYLDPSSEKTKQHLIVLEKELKGSDSLFYRYKHSDDFGKPSSTFLICAWWYVEALACVGRIKEAVTGFKQLLKYSNHLGLFSEDVEEKTGSQWGNFPQTYSHVGLMNAAFRIAKKIDLPDFL